MKRLFFVCIALVFGTLLKDRSSYSLTFDIIKKGKRTKRQKKEDENTKTQKGKGDKKAKTQKYQKTKRQKDKKTYISSYQEL